MSHGPVTAAASVPLDPESLALSDPASMGRAASPAPVSPPPLSLPPASELPSADASCPGDVASKTPDSANASSAGDVASETPDSVLVASAKPVASTTPVSPLGGVAESPESLEPCADVSDPPESAGCVSELLDPQPSIGAHARNSHAEHRRKDMFCSIRTRPKRLTPRDVRASVDGDREAVAAERDTAGSKLDPRLHRVQIPGALDIPLGFGVLEESAQVQVGHRRQHRRLNLVGQVRPAVAGPARSERR